jgi:hypothetical protein
MSHGSTGSVAPSKLFNARAMPALRGTLTAADLEPEWRAPAVRVGVPMPPPRR